MGDRDVQFDVIDLIIDTLKKHEKELDKSSQRVLESARILSQVSQHSLDAEKLNRIEELLVFSRTHLEDIKKISDTIYVNEILEVYNKILREIRK